MATPSSFAKAECEKMSAFDKISRTFDLVVDAKTDTFSELADLAGLAPETDFQNVDLSGIDFGPSDLTDYVFRGSTLDDCDLSKSIFGVNTLDGVRSLKGTRLPAKIEPSDRRFTSISGRLSRRDRYLAEVEYGSMRRAATTAISALMQMKDQQVIEQIGSIIRSGSTREDLEERISHFTLPISRIEYVRRMRSKSGYQATDIMRAVLLLANAARSPADYETILNTDSTTFSQFLTRLPRQTPIADDQMSLF